jgi:hypothetical protein
MSDTLRSCYIQGTMKLLGSSLGAYDCAFDPAGGNIRIGTERPSSDPYASPSSCTNCRRTGMDVTLNGITAMFDDTYLGAPFISAGLEVDDGTNDIPSREMYLDSLKVLMGNFGGAVASTGTAGRGSAFYNCYNMAWRGNEWTWRALTPGTHEIHTFRDSLDNFKMDCDTVVCIEPNSGEEGNKIKWNYNAYSFGAGRDYYIVDSCYIQVSTNDWYRPLCGSFTYTTFVGKSGLGINNNTVMVDSVAGVIFNHCTFISTTYQQAAVLPFQDLYTDADGNPYGWPITSTDGQDVTFTNNLVFRARTYSQSPAVSGGYFTFATVNPLVTWGRVGQGAVDEGSGISTPTRDVAKKISTDWNLYAMGNYYTEKGDFSVGWKSGQFSTQNMASRPGPTTGSGITRRGLFKYVADSSAAGLDAQLNPAGYDSNSVYCYPREAGLNQWLVDSTFSTIWTQGTKVDTRVATWSQASGRGSGSSTIGAVASTGSWLVLTGTTTTDASVTVVNDTTLTIVDNTSSDASFSVAMRNDGIVDATITYTTTPLGGYIVSAEAIEAIAPSGTATVNMYLLDPSYANPEGIYYVTLTFRSLFDLSIPLRHINIRVTKGSVISD